MVKITASKLPREVTTVSLFSGCGGTDLALKTAGYSVVWANDFWDEACDTYSDNLPNPTIECADIRDVRAFPDAELLVGCYPCQGYTQGGKRDWDAPENFLYLEFARALKLISPKAFMVENVIGMTFGASKLLLQDQLNRFSENYKVKYAVLNAKDYGVAQNRRRVIIVGIRRDVPFQYDFPDPTHGPHAGRPYTSQKEALKWLRNPPEQEFNREPLHWYYLSRRRRANWDEPSPCIVGHWRHVPLHPSSPPLCRVSTDEWVFEGEGEARRLSYKECGRLQGFPRDFRWLRGNVRDRFQMIGNAVPPPLFQAVLQPLEDLWS